MPDRKIRRSVLLIMTLAFGLFLAAGASPAAAGRLTSPREQFGFNIGDDYRLVNYGQLLGYWKKLDAESDRLTLVDIGRTAGGRTMVMAVITSPKNQARLGRYKEISRRLALARGLTDETARRLASEGKAVVWIDGGLHASEVLGSQQLVELVWQLVSGRDAETRRILDDCILLAVPANPDGLDLVADWYMREKEPARRSMRGLPVLYQKYIGHDNNRDFYMVTQPETEAMARQLFREWHPQIIYNHHQSGPSGTVLFAPPFRDPFNYLFDPLIPAGIDLVSASMHNRFISEDKPGATMRSSAPYSTWWNGGLRSTGYFHNVIGILTETIGGPSPIDIPFIPERLLPEQDYPYPVAPGKWHFRQSVDYSITADKAILDVASRHREDFLYRRYLMGRNAIDKGGRDTWTIVPSTIGSVRAAMARDKAAPVSREPEFSDRPAPGAPVKYYEMIFDKALRDPRGYVIPSDQPDFPTAAKFVNTLIKNGCEVLRAAKGFTIGAGTYPAGSYIVKTAQAFRPHIMSMFEPQDHPDDIAYPGGPPTPPYDAAGWTLAYQMGIQFDRILDPFEGPFEPISEAMAVPAGRFEERPGAAGWVLDHRVNDSFVAVNRALKAGLDVYWLKDGLSLPPLELPAGAFFIPSAPDPGAAAAVLGRAARDKGLDIRAVDLVPSGPSFKLKLPRIGLWDTYGGSMASGWLRWLLEQFEFPFELVFAPDLDKGGLGDRFDCLVFADGSMPGLPADSTASGAPAESGPRPFPLPAPESVPEEFRGRIGRITVDETIPQIRTFLEQGGTVLAFERASRLAFHLHLPLADALTETSADGKEQRIGREKFYIPGSILRARVDASHPLAHGMPAEVDVFYDNSPCFTLLPGPAAYGVRAVVWFGEGRLLRSGWAWGEGRLRNTAQVVEAAVGKGKLFLYGPDVAFRGQPHGTFKLLFNGLYYGPAKE